MRRSNLLFMGGWRMPFSSKSLSFLRSLSRNNDRDWFEARREIYERDLRLPAREFIDGIKAPLSKLFPHFRIDYRSVGRIHRDTRFSPDKRPYKNYVSFAFKDRTSKESGFPDLYVGFDSTGVVLAIGSYAFSKPVREHFRDRVTTSPHAESFSVALRKAERSGFKVSGRDLKKVPIGYDPDHPNVDFLRHNGVYVVKEYDPSPVFLSDRFPAWIVKQIAPTLPFYSWMREMAKSGPRDLSRFLS
jgi:uncharacterized protein (TIGR02453 family)